MTEEEQKAIEELLLETVKNYEEYHRDEYHAVYSIQLCELINDGWIDFSSEDWDFDYYDKTLSDLTLVINDDFGLYISKFSPNVLISSSSLSVILL